MFVSKHDVVNSACKKSLSLRIYTEKGQRGERLNSPHTVSARDAPLWAHLGTTGCDMCTRTLHSCDAAPSSAFCLHLDSRLGT